MIIKRLFTSQVLPRRITASRPAEPGAKVLPRRDRDPMTERWHRYKASGQLKHALSGGVVEIGELRFAIDRALVAAHEFFFIEGWIIGPGANALAFEVMNRKAPCIDVAFRRPRLDVNKAYDLPQAFPHDRVGFQIFGQIPRPAERDDGVLGLRVLEMLQGDGKGALRRPLCTVPVRTQGCTPGDVWRALNEALGRHAVVGTDLGPAVSLLNRIRARDVKQRASLPFPANDGQAIDVLILARNRPEIAEMNATLMQQILPPNARLFVAAVNRAASLQTGELMTGLPQKHGISVQHMLTSVTLPSSFVVEAFLESDHAPSVAIVLDDIFIGPCLDELASAIVSRQSIVVPRANQPLLTPSIPLPRLQTANGQLAGSLHGELMTGPVMPLGAAVLHEKICMNVLPLRTYYGRGLTIEEIYSRNYDTILLTDKACLDLEIEDQKSERYFFNRALLAQAASEGGGL